MTKEKKTVDTEAAAEDTDVAAEEDTDEESAEEEEAAEDTDAAGDSEDGDDSDGSKKKDDLDLDAELEKERKAGEPDLEIADDAFKEREKKRKEGAADDGDKPLTQKDLDVALARDRKERQSDDALIIAKEMAGSEKEAELIVAKWRNRTFPRTLTLREQVREAYVITHSKKILGERDEAMRALRGKNGVNRNPANTHRDAARSGNEPKLDKGVAAQLKTSGYAFNNVRRQYEKKLPNGRMLIYDVQTKQTRLLKKQ